MDYTGSIIGGLICAISVILFTSKNSQVEVKHRSFTNRSSLMLLIGLAGLGGGFLFFSLYFLLFPRFDLRYSIYFGLSCFLPFLIFAIYLRLKGE